MSLFFPVLQNLGKPFYHVFLPPSHPPPYPPKKQRPPPWFFCRFFRGRRLRRQAPPTKWELQQPGLYVRLLWAKVTQRNLAMGSSARCRVKRYASRDGVFSFFAAATKKTCKSNAAMGKHDQVNRKLVISVRFF